MDRTGRTKVLHVLGSLGRGGVETWLMHVWRNIDRDKFQFDFLLHTESTSVYQDEAKALGARLLRCPETGRWDRYARSCAQLLRQHGPYDVVHSHVHYFSALPLTIARRERVPIRIAHSHQAPIKRSSPVRAAYELLMRFQLQRTMTRGLAISETAAAGLFGRGWRRKEAVSVLLYGFDFSAFRGLPDRRTQKRELGLPKDRVVLGHIGRFVDQKNHKFLLEVFAAFIKRGADAHLVMLGAGPLEPEIRQLASRLGLLERCTFAGDQGNVAPWLRAMDLFVLPSLYEGLGIVAIEAQAAGTRLLISEQVPREADLLPERITRLPLDAGAEKWAVTAETMLSCDLAEAPDSVDRVSSGIFGIARCLRDLQACYHGGMPLAKPITPFYHQPQEQQV